MGLFGIHNHIWGQIIGGVFASLAIAISFYEIYRHIHYNHNKYVRRYIIRILFMVPVYVIESWFGIIYPQASLYLNAIRDIYEAITVYSFYQLLINSLGGFHDVNQSLKQSNAKQEFPHMFPFKYCCKPWKFIQTDFDPKQEFLLTRRQSSVLNVPIPNAFDYENSRSNPFFRRCTIGVLQYCFVQIISCIIIFILESCDVFEEGEYKFTVGYPYFVVILSVSQSWAIYCLVLFYYSIKHIDNNYDSVYIKFKRMKPVWKFLCIKGVVFFTYWQSIGIAFLVHFNIIHDDMMNSIWTADNIANSLQDFIICIEMFCFAVIHHFAFHPSDFIDYGDDEEDVDNVYDKSANIKKVGKAVIDAVNVSDIVINAKDAVDLKNSKAVKVINIININKKMDKSVDKHNSDNQTVAIELS